MQDLSKQIRFRLVPVHPPPPLLERRQTRVGSALTDLLGELAGMMGPRRASVQSVHSVASSANSAERQRSAQSLASSLNSADGRRSSFKPRAGSLSPGRFVFGRCQARRTSVQSVQSVASSVNSSEGGSRPGSPAFPAFGRHASPLAHSPKSGYTRERLEITGWHAPCASISCITCPCRACSAIMQSLAHPRHEPEAKRQRCASACCGLRRHCARRATGPRT